MFIRRGRRERSENSFSFCFVGHRFDGFWKCQGFICFSNVFLTTKRKQQQWLDNSIQFPNRRMFSFDRVKNAKCAEQLAFDCGKTMPRKMANSRMKMKMQKKNKYPKRSTLRWPLTIGRENHRSHRCACFCSPSFPKLWIHFAHSQALKRISR